MTKFVAALILPPLNLLLVATLACVLAPRWPRLSRGLLVATLFAAYLSCKPAVTGS